MSLYDLKVGDRVQVFDVNGSRMGQPKGGWDGTVAKVGRKLIYVDYAGSRPGGDAFRLEDGQRNDVYGHQHIETVERAAEKAARSNLIVRLRGHGVELRSGHSLTTSKMEALVRVLEEDA